MSSARQIHWESVYGSKQESQFSWHQDDPAASLGLIREHCPPGPGVSAIDVGGGTSLLASRLVQDGYPEVAVLDVSPIALERARQRAVEAADEAVAAKIRWIASDVLDADRLGIGPFSLWHDRAVFHFLTDAAEQSRYAAAAARLVKPAGCAIIGAFAPDGPRQCSDLPVQRHDERSIASILEPAGFRLVRSSSETHVTPWGKAQPFNWVVLRRDI